MVRPINSEAVAKQLKQDPEKVIEQCKREMITYIRKNKGRWVETAELLEKVGSKYPTGVGDVAKHRIRYDAPVDWFKNDDSRPRDDGRPSIFYNGTFSYKWRGRST